MKINLKEKRLVFLLVFLTHLLTAHLLTLFFVSAVYGDTHTAAGLSAAAVQDAIDAASNGDTVIVLAGTATWAAGTGISISKGITVQGAGIDQTVIITPGGYNVGISNNTGSLLRLTGFTFDGTGYPGAGYGDTISIGDAMFWRVDHIKFKNTFNAFIISGNAEGLIDSCTYYMHETKTQYTPFFLDYRSEYWDNGSCSHWYYNHNRPLAPGTSNAVYCEDCHIDMDEDMYRSSGILAGTNGARLVFRYNTGFGPVDVCELYGVNTGNSRGISWAEIYKNKIHFKNFGYAFQFRGGTGVVFDNEITGDTSGWGQNFNLRNNRSCETQRHYYCSGGVTDEITDRCNGSSSFDGNTPGMSGYPCLDQIGRGPGPIGNQSSAPLYAWNNKYNGVNFDAENINECSTGASHIQEGRDFYNGIQKPGYTPYTYPHPLRGTAPTDTTPPSAPGTVRDGTGTSDIDSTASTTQLSANWTAATDSQSGISGYKYAIGTTAGGTNTLGWQTLGNVLTVTRTGLTLSVGQAYYFSVKAVNGASLDGSATNSDGQLVTGDSTPPSAPGTVRDGTGTTDINSTTSRAQLSANWTAATDAESGIGGYRYAIGTTAGGTQAADWTDLANVTAVTRTGLTLAAGTTYYFSVRAVNGAGTAGPAVNSNGQFVVSGETAYWKFNDGTGTSAQDSSGGGHTGTLINSPLWASGKIGGALSFDGTDDQMTFSAITLNDTFSVSMWIYPVPSSDNYGALLTDNGGSTGFYYRGVTHKLNFYTGAGHENNTAITENQWHHVVLVNNAGSYTFYLDGAGDGAGTGGTGFDAACLGKSNYTNPEKFKGTIDDARIYNYALTIAEVQALYNAAVQDTTPPSIPGTVRDGTGTTDINSTTSRMQLSANWTAATDAESGISGYSYAIGITAGGTNITNWTTVGSVLTATKTGLTLAVGATYYFSVKATNGAGLTGGATNSNGQVVLSTAVADTTAPSSPATVRDGPTAGTDTGFTYSTTTLSANWTASSDGESGIASYQYTIGTTAGATNITNWVTIGNVLTVTKTGLALTAGTTYYFSVKAVNGAGLTGTAANSNGQYVATVNTADTTPPSNILQVRDGNDAGVDANVTYLTDELSANWDSSADAESGIARYYYAIGTTAGGTNITNGWKDNGELTEVTQTGLTLETGTTYYFSVKAENGVSLQSDLTNSNGQLVLSQDTQGPLISNVSAQGITSSGVTITWETDELATSRVEYGLTAGYGSLTGEYIVMNTAHSVSISGLQPQAQYHYRVISRDYSGNESASADHAFTTLAAPVGTGEINAYPNPSDFKNGQVIKFKIGAAGTETGEVRIYTLSGKLVRKLTAQPGATEISWDGTNENNEKVTRGIYIYTIISTDGDKKTGKLAVVR